MSQNIQSDTQSATVWKSGNMMQDIKVGREYDFLTASLIRVSN